MVSRMRLGVVLGLSLALAATCLEAQTTQRKPKKKVVLQAQPAEPKAPGDIQSNYVECVDPEVGPPPAVRSRSGRTPRRAPLRAMPYLSLQQDKSAQELSFTAPAVAKTTSSQSQAATQLAPNASTACKDVAITEFFKEGMVLPQMPPVNYPDQPCQDRSRCVTTTKAWIRAHHNVWIARQMIHLVAKEDEKYRREWMWKQPGEDKNGNSAAEDTSPAYWFGPYSDKRFATIKEGIDDLWNVMKTNKTGGISIELKCPFESEEPNNVCHTVKPAAHHWVKGYVNMCDSFYDEKKNNGWGRARLMAHELMHHLWVKYGDIWVAVQDKHYHGHGPACVASPDSSSQYGESKIRHLVTYRNASNSDCGHLKRNARNNDSYAYFITTVGSDVYNGKMVRWPKKADPTPKPPQCVGDENCLCLTKDTFPANQYFEPDGDFSADTWCDDHSGEMTCVSTKFGTQPEGICTRCDKVRGPGCECDDARPCDVGDCYGDDTFGGGTGQCYKAPPPDWACLADCERLFNDEAAWCYMDYPSGEAHCMDNLCTEPDAWNCHQQGKVCRYGECVVECATNDDCKQKGYPDTFICQQSRCEFGY